MLPKHKLSLVGAVITAIGVLFLCIGTGTDYWLQSTQNSDVHQGLWNVCFPPSGCLKISVDTDCKVGDSPTGSDVDKCRRLNAERAFILLGLLVGALSVLLFLLVTATGNQSIRHYADYLCLISSILSMIGISIFVDSSKDDVTSSGGYKRSYSFGLACAGWLLEFVGFVIFFCASRGLDKETGGDQQQQQQKA